MISKEHTGWRLAALRRRAQLSQSALADRLGVTPQAVSKWETGSALPDIETLLALSHLYATTVNALLEDRDLLCELTGQPTPADGVACFAPEEDAPIYRNWAQEIVRGDWVSRNWRAACEHPDLVRSRIGGHITSLGGLILETGCGPGGGFMPYILQHDPTASIILNDLSPTVVRQWRRLLERLLPSPNLYFASFDFTHMPFPDGCIDVISDGGGIGNTIGSRAQALRECWRVLKPGGRLITSTGFVTQQTLAALPAQVQQALLTERPDVFDSLYDEAVQAGFMQIDSEICGGWDTEGDDSAIADLARSLGVNLHFTSYIRTCIKP